MQKILLFVVTLALAASCTKSGCTDTTALNYDSKANENCCCNYSGKAVLWYDDATAAALNADGINLASFYFDNQLIISYGTSVAWSTAPTCEGSGGVKMSKGWADGTSATGMYSVRDQNNNTIWGGQIEFTGNSCLVKKLVY